MHFGTVQIVELIIMAACAAAVWLSARKNCTPRVRWGAVLLTLCALFPAEKLQESLSLTKDRSLIFAFFAFMGVVTILVTTLLEQRTKWERCGKRYLGLWNELKGWKLFAFYALHYTLLFVVLSYIIFSPFREAEKTLIWTADGMPQHFTYLNYFKKTIQESFATLFSGGGWQFPLYDFHLGPVKQMTSSEIIPLFSALWPGEQVDKLFDALTVFRLFLVGLSFSLMGFYFQGMLPERGRLSGTSNETEIVPEPCFEPLSLLTGAVAYTFCGFSLWNGTRHPFMLANLMLLPLLVIGVERILRKGGPVLFAVLVFVTEVNCGSYFTAIIGILIILYALLRFFDLYCGSIREKPWRLFGIFLLSGLSGILLSGISLLPGLIKNFETGRAGRSVFTDDGLSQYFLYDKAYYQTLVNDFILTPLSFGLHVKGGYTSLGFSALAVPAVAALFTMREEHARFLRRIFLAATAMMCLPLIGYVLSGFNVIYNRWNFGYALCISAILLFAIPRLANMEPREMLRVGTGALMYFVVLFLTEGQYRKIWTAFFLLASVALLFLCRRLGQTRVLAACLALTCVSACYSGYLMFDAKQQNLASSFNKAPYDSYNSSQYASFAGSQIKKNTGGFYRTQTGSNEWPVINAAYYWDINGLSYYSSYIYNGYRSWRNELEYNDAIDNINDYGDENRLGFSSLSCVRFYLKRGETGAVIPYGFKQVEEVKNSAAKAVDQIYENQLALPIGYTYASYLPKEQWQTLSALEKQEAQLQAVALDGTPSSVEIKTVEPAYSATRITDITMEWDGASWKDGVLTVSKENAKVKLTFAGQPSAETYLRVNNLDLTDGDSIQRWTLRVSTDQGSATGRFAADGYLYSNGLKSQIFNLGYSDEPQTACTLTFPSKGTFHLDDLEVWCMPVEHYAERIEALRAEPLENVELNYRGLTGDITVSTDKLLCFSIPYDSGWSAYVDGQKVKLYQANTAWMAVELTAGYHTVELKYWTPGLTAGIAMSVIGAAMLLVLIVLRKRSPADDARPEKEKSQLKKLQRAEQKARRKRAWDEAWKSLSATNDPTEADEDAGIREENEADTEAAPQPENETAGSEAPEPAADASADVQSRETPRRKQKKRR